MEITLRIKPISINICWQGRRFKTKEYKQFCKDIAILLEPYKNIRFNGYVEVNYKWYTKNWKVTDWDNKIKPFQDCLVNSGIIKDDRFIMKGNVEKIPSETDYIKFEIKEYTMEVNKKNIDIKPIFNEHHCSKCNSNANVVKCSDGSNDVYFCRPCILGQK